MFVCECDNVISFSAKETMLIMRCGTEEEIHLLRGLQGFNSWLMRSLLKRENERALNHDGTMMMKLDD